MAINITRVLMGFGTWFLLGFALQGADEKEGNKAYIKDSKELEKYEKVAKAAAAKRK